MSIKNSLQLFQEDRAQQELVRKLQRVIVHCTTNIYEALEVTNAITNNELFDTVPPDIKIVLQRWKEFLQTTKDTFNKDSELVELYKLGE